MASAPQQGLPLFYNDLTPLAQQIHGDWKMKPLDKLPILSTTHAVPLLAEEFISASRYYPIIFTTGPDPVPLALMGLNEGVNVFADENGMFPTDYYIPAYIRRYPFMLARLRPDVDELSLCVDAQSGVVGQFEEGDPIFVGEEPSEQTKGVLTFCEQMEQASQNTDAFFRDLAEQKLLIDGEFSATPIGAEQPFVYRGFQIVSEEALKNLRGDVARKWVGSGLMALVFAHLFSLQLLSNVFGRQMQQGKIPEQPTGPILA